MNQSKNTTSVFTALCLLVLMFFTSSCKEEKAEVDVQGGVTVAFTPVVNSNVPESYYCYLYAFEGYPNRPPLDQKYLSTNTFINGKTRITFEKLNAGNYVVTYYNNRTVVENTVQVTPGKMNNFDL